MKLCNLVMLLKFLQRTKYYITVKKCSIVMQQECYNNLTLKYNTRTFCNTE